jgi:hypothetical protein
MDESLWRQTMETIPRTQFNDPDFRDRAELAGYNYLVLVLEGKILKLRERP